MKTRRFKEPKYVGDPINAIRIFNEKEVDELLVLDIDASKSGKEPDYKVIEQLAGECFMPLCYGGGVRTIDQAARIFDLGVEKISLQTAVLSDVGLITEIARRFGSQSVVISVDLKRDWRRNVRLYESRTGKLRAESWIEFAKHAVLAGAGELLVNVVDRDGEMAGYDLNIVRDAAAAVNVPVIAAGGARNISDFKEAIDSGASAVAAGAMFVFHGPHRAVLITYPRYSDLENLLGQEKQ